MHGYCGAVLVVDLSSGGIVRAEVPDEDYRRFLGGRGLGMKILWDVLDRAGVDALSPENPLMFMAGPFSGFPIPSASRTCVVTKSPCTSPADGSLPGASTVSYSNVGGYLGPEIRFAGYDGIIVTGASRDPVMLVVDDDRVELRDASHLWGLGTDAVDRTLLEELGRSFQTCCIGPAGENLVRYACIVHTPARTAGRGVGAVMGSKRLKALAVRGTGQPGVARHQEFLGQIDRAIRRFDTPAGTALVKIMRNQGTAFGIELASHEGRMTVQNYRECSFRDVKKIGARAAQQGAWVRSFACYCCRQGCKSAGVVRQGPHSGLVHDGPEYETGVMFGSNLMVSDLPGILRAITLGDDLGMDLISAGNVAGFLMEAVERGAIDRTFLDGIDLHWGNIDAALELVHKIGARDGIGDLASRGVKALAEAIGGDAASYAIHVKGMELAAHNPRTQPVWATSYATANRGGCHQAGGNQARQDFTAAYDSLGICMFATNFGIPVMPGLRDRDLASLLTAITGESWSAEDLVRAGERIYNLEKAFNVREGFRRVDDELPARFFDDAPTHGASKGKTFDRDEWTARMDGYYEARGWDPATTVPQRARLEALDLDFVADELDRTLGA